MRLSRATTSRCLMRPLGQVGVGGRYHLLELPLLALSQAYHYFSPPTPQSLSGKNQLEGSGVDVGEAQNRDCGNLGASTDWVM